MALTIPLIQRPGSILFLDDDPDYLDMLGMVMPAQWQIGLYARPTAFCERMRDEPSLWEADAARQTQIIERWRQGRPLLPQMLDYWALNPGRYQLAQVCVVDYAMPGTNGLAVLNTLLDWPGARVLLTGQADEQVAIQAFNSGLIDRFIPKQSDDITRRLLETLEKLAHAPHPRLNTLWRGVLQPLQHSLLQIPSVARQLQDHARKRWVEYVVLGQPFGVLGVDAEGRCEWLQLELASQLGDLAELASSAGAGLDVVRAIRNARLLAAVEMQQQLQLGGAIRTAEAIAVGDDGLLLAAVFPLSPADMPQPIPAYRQVLEAQSDRQILDV